jgi:hypothetical protein
MILGFRVYSLGLRFRVYKLWFRMRVYGFRVKTQKAVTKHQKTVLKKTLSF